MRCLGHLTVALACQCTPSAADLCCAPASRPSCGRQFVVTTWGAAILSIERAQSHTVCTTQSGQQASIRAASLFGAVCRRHIQLQAAGGVGFSAAAGRIFSKGGPAAFYKGFLPNALKNLPNKSELLTSFMCRFGNCCHCLS